MMNPVHVKILRDGAKLPTYGTAGAAGADLYACVDAPVTIRPGFSTSMMLPSYLF